MTLATITEAADDLAAVVILAVPLGALILGLLYWR